MLNPSLIRMQKMMNMLVPGRKNLTMRIDTRMDGTAFCPREKMPWGEKNNGSAIHITRKSSMISTNCASAAFINEKIDIMMKIGADAIRSSAIIIRKKRSDCE